MRIKKILCSGLLMGIGLLCSAHIIHAGDVVYERPETLLVDNKKNTVEIKDDEESVLTTSDGFTYKIEGGGAVITGYTGTDTEIDIPDTIAGEVVWKIGDNAFLDKSSLKSITIPKNVTNLGKCAFKNCTGLTEMTIKATNLVDLDPASISTSYWTNYTQNTSVFYNAGSRAGFTVDFDDGCISVPSYMFATAYDRGDNSYCRITKVTMADTVKNINEYAFYKCFDLNEVVIGINTTDIANNAFAYNESL